MRNRTSVCVSVGKCTSVKLNNVNGTAQDCTCRNVCVKVYGVKPYSAEVSQQRTLSWLRANHPQGERHRLRSLFVRRIRTRLCVVTTVDVVNWGGSVATVLTTNCIFSQRFVLCDVGVWRLREASAVTG